MPMVKRVHLINEICRKVSCKRKDFTKTVFDKRELRYIDSYLSITDSLRESVNASKKA